MNPLDREMLLRFLELAGERLRGDWVVLGGTVLPILGVEHRVTVDVDVAGPDDAGMDQTLALMEIAEELGLPVEAINQAGAFFLRRVPDWRAHLKPVHRGSRAVLHVPDATLFLLLKLRRLTESDLLDCRAMIEHAERQGERVDGTRVEEEISSALAAGTSPGRRERLEGLREAVRASRGDRREG